MQRKRWWKEGSASWLMCSLLGEGARGSCGGLEDRENSLHWFGFWFMVPQLLSQWLMNCAWEKKKRCENSCWGRRRWLHLVVTGQCLISWWRSCAVFVWSVLPFSCSSLLIWTFVWCGFRGKQQVPPVLAEGQIPRCPGSRPCTAEVEGHYKHMKDPIMYFLQANKTQRIFFFNVCTIVGSQLDAFISLLSFYSVFTQWPFKNIWRLSIPPKTHSGNNLLFICQEKNEAIFLGPNY